MPENVGIFIGFNPHSREGVALSISGLAIDLIVSIRTPVKEWRQRPTLD